MRRGTQGGARRAGEAPHSKSARYGSLGHVTTKQEPLRATTLLKSKRQHLTCHDTLRQMKSNEELAPGIGAPRPTVSNRG